MEGAGSQIQARSKAPAARKCPTEGGSPDDARDSSLPEAADSLQSIPTLGVQYSGSVTGRTRRARPGAHFQPPQASSRGSAPLAHCNTLFLPSTLQAPQGLQDTRLEETKAAPAVRGQMPRSDAYILTHWQQSHSGVVGSRPPSASPGIESGSAHRLPIGAKADAGPHEARVWHSSSDRSASSPSRPGAPKSRAPAGGGPLLLPAGLYLKALQRVKAVTSGKRITSAARNADISMEGAPPLKLFCGTWNCQYQEFPVSVLTNSKTASRLPGGGPNSSTGMSANPASALPVSPLAAESLPEEVPAEVIAKLDGDFESLYEPDVEGTSRFEPNGQPHVAADTSPPEVIPFSRRGTIKRGDLVRSSTKCLTAVEGEDQPFSDWLLPGYDIYIVSLQETLGQSIFDTVTAYLTIANGVPYKRIRFQEDKLSGLGDGAWMQFKSTSLAVWAREDLEGEGKPISLVSSKAASVSFLSGSKGGVSVCLKIWDQFFCFIGCHMPSTSPEDRRKARAVIEQRLLEFYGGATSWREAFHHVLWMGDFNFRTQRVTTQRAVSLLKQSWTGLVAFDEWVGPNGEDMRTAGFVEAPISFPPTYKKADGRPPIDMSRSKWVEDEYQTHMVTQWYKGSRHQDRIPSWTDRIFKCSAAEVSSLVRFQPNLYFCAMPNRPSFLIASDHSPVGLGLECFPLDAAYVLPEVTSNSSHSKKAVLPGGSKGMHACDTLSNTMFVEG